FVWAGLACLSYWSRAGRRRDLLVAAVAFGIAGLTRVENAAFLLVALIFAAALAPNRPPLRALLPLVVAMGIWVHAGIHLMVFRTHYFGNLRQFFADEFGSVRPSTMIAMLTVGVVFAVLFRLRRPSRRRPAPSVYVSCLIFIVGLALVGDWQRGWPAFRLL